MCPHTYKVLVYLAYRGTSKCFCGSNNRNCALSFLSYYALSVFPPEFTYTFSMENLTVMKAFSSYH